MNVKEKFVELTKRTYPHGTESELFHLLPAELETDQFGNRYIQIGDKPTTMFTSHLDTVRQTVMEIKHVFEGDFIKTDEKTILGADDKAGVTVMLYMIENKVPGLYYFFLGEEVGCVGSKKLSDFYSKKEKPDYIKKVVSFDRKGTDSIITFQYGNRCCSDEFGNALASALNEASKKVEDNDTVFNYRTDDTGVVTDSAQFMSVYPECTNISVGYYSEHHDNERQNIKHLDNLAKSCVHVDWEALPIKRDPSVTESKYKKSYGTHSYGRRDEYEQSEYYYGNRKPASATKEEKIAFVDYEFGIFISHVIKDKTSGKVKSVSFALDRINHEKQLIIEFFEHLRVDYKEITWQGDKLIIWYNQTTQKLELSRAEISVFIPELDFWIEMSKAQKEHEFFPEAWCF